MKEIIESKYQIVSRKFSGAVDCVHQAVQAIRWRITNMPDDLPSLDNEIGRLTSESSEIAKIYGEFAAFTSLLTVQGANDVVDQLKATTMASSQILDWNFEGDGTTNRGGAILPDEADAEPSPGPIDAVTLAEKMKSLRAKSATRLRGVAESLVAESGVTSVVHDQKSLKGYAYVQAGEKPSGVIHVPLPTTRRRLYVFAHECGHVALGHDGSVPYHRQEFEAERWAHAALRRHGIAVPKKEHLKAKEYVARKIHQAVVRGAKQIDRASYQFSKDHAFPSVRRWLTEGGILCDLSLCKSLKSRAAA